jgi:general secretion pathway protein B
MLLRYRATLASKGELKSMSYILDALKKAERERGIAQVPTLMTVHDARITPRNHWRLVSGGLVIFIAASLRFFLHSRSASKHSPETPPNHSVSNPETDHLEVTRAQPPAPLNSESPISASQASLPSLKTKSVQNEPGGVPTAVKSNSLSTAKSEVSVPALTVLRQSLQESGIISPEVSASAPTPPTNQAKPVSLREAMAKLSLSILVYADDKAERMVFINGRKYIEGEYVDGGYLLESISQEGAVLSYQGERALLKLGPK